MMGNVKLLRIRRNRLRLVASTALAFGVLAAVAPSAFAACAVVVGVSVTCNTTTTTDTTFNPAVNPSNARDYQLNALVPLDFSVDAGAVVDGFGLSFRNAGAGGIRVVNDGTIQVNAGNTPSAGGGAAVELSSSAAGSAQVSYFGGAGTSVVNNGNGRGISAANNGALSVSSNGTVTSMNSTGIFASVNSANNAHTLTVTSNGDIRAALTGISAQRDNGDGALTINSAGTIGSSGAPGTFNVGITAATNSSADIAINVSADIGSATDRAEFNGIVATKIDPTADGTISVDLTNANVFTARGTYVVGGGEGAIKLRNRGVGDVVLQLKGTSTVDSLGTAGIGVFADDGDIDISSDGAGNSVAGDYFGVSADVTGTGGISIAGMTITGGDTGLNASIRGATTTGINVMGAGDITAGTNNAVNLYVLNAAATGDILYNRTGNISANGFGINAANAGSGNIEITHDGDITSLISDGIYSSAWGNTRVVFANDHTISAVTGINVQQNGGATTEALIENAGTINALGNGIRHRGIGNVEIKNFGNVNSNNSAIYVENTTQTATVFNAGILNGAVNLLTSDVATSNFNNVGEWNTLARSSLISGSLNNQGIINAAEGTVIPSAIRVLGDYNGTGGTLMLDAFLAGPGSLADVLTVDGNTSGSTNIMINDTNIGMGAYNPDGIALVQVGGTTAATHFTLAGGTIHKGVFDYNLVLDAATNTHELITLQNAAALAPGSILTGAENIWQDVADAWSARQDNLRDDVLRGSTVTAVADPPLAEAKPSMFWMAGLGGWDKRDARGTDLAFDQSIYGIVGGADFGTQLSDATTLLYGVQGGYVMSNLSIDDSYNSKADLSGGTAGAYASLLSQGFFANALVSADFLGADINVNGATASTNSNTFGLRVDSGYRAELNNGFFAEPMLSASFARTNMDSFSVAGVNYDPDDATQAMLGGGARLGFANQGLNASVTGRVWNEFTSDNTFYATPVGPGFTVTDGGMFNGVFGEVDGKLAYDFTDSSNIFADLRVRFDDEATAVSAKAGFSFKW